MALVLLSTALVPTFVLAGDALKLSERIKNSLIAANLAQEGVEVVRALRDSNWFSDQPFDTGLTACTVQCTVQYDSGALIIGTYDGVPLKLDAATDLYQYDTGTATAFQRKIIVTSVSATQLKVESIVSWRERGIAAEKSLTVEYFLFDWAQ